MSEPRWRARVEWITSGDADPEWTGRWRPFVAAARQALRWRDDIDGRRLDYYAIWLECEDGRTRDVA